MDALQEQVVSETPCIIDDQSFSLVCWLQLKREPRPFPTLQIKRKVTDIDDFQFEDFSLLDYKPYPRIKMEMAV